MRKQFSRLRALRESRDIRQLDLVIRTGLSPATIWRAEQPGAAAFPNKADYASRDVWASVRPKSPISLISPRRSNTDGSAFESR